MLFKLLFLALCFVSTLDAMSLSQADKALKGGNKDKIFDAYDAYKSIYLKSTVTDDKKVQKRALQGIVTSGKKLNIDILKYEKKLNVLLGKKDRTSASATHEKRVVDIYWSGDKLIVEFSKRLRATDINFLRLKKSKTKGYRYVFDIHALLDNNKAPSHSKLKRVTVSQYKPSTIRVVLESSSSIKVRFKRDNKRLIVYLNGFKSSAKTLKEINLQEGKIIVLDPGHGGKDGGAVGNRVVEKKVVLSIAKELQRILKSRGHTVYMTRDSDKFLKLSSRTKYANRKKADLFISIHANAMPKKSAATTHGIETYFLSRSRTKRAERVAAKENAAAVEDMSTYGKNSFLNTLSHEKIIASHKLSIDLQSNMLRTVRKHYRDVRDGGVKEGPFWILVGAQMPAALVEVGFLTHPKESKRLNTLKYRKYIARGLADGVERYFFNNP